MTRQGRDGRILDGSQERGGRHEADAEERGRRTAELLQGSWRDEPPPAALDAAALDDLADHLLACGLSGLGWRAIRSQPALAGRPAGQRLQEGHRLHALQAAVHERRLATVLDLCADLGVDPLLVKGPTVARHHPERGLRPYGDVDLLVSVEERPRLRDALDRRPHSPTWVDVDLEHAFARADATPLAELRGRGERLRLAGRSVLVPGPEDLLRLVCLHYLRAGGWRALSLVDVALLLEQARTAPTDWRVVLPADRRAGWVAQAAALAVELLGADPSGTPLAGHLPPIAPWLRAHVLRGFGSTPADRAPAGAWTRTADPRRLGAALRARWPPDPLEVALHHRWRVPARNPALLGAVDGLERAAGLLTGLPLARGGRGRPSR